MKYLAFSLLILISSIKTSAQQYDLVAIKDSISAHLKKNDIPGMFVSIIKNDQVILQEGFGHADLYNDIATTDQHLFRIGSITKTFTSMAILKLIEDGKLALDSQLKDIAPEIPFDNPFAHKYAITIKDLLGHRAGFDDMHLSAFTKERAKDMTAFDEVLCYKNSLKSRWEPGIAHAYSNPGYSILGYIIEKFSGISYQQYILEQIIQPLGMQRTHFTSQADHYTQTCQYAIGYDMKNETIRQAKNEALIGEAAGALLSNAEDMAKLVAFFTNTQMQTKLDIISPKSVELMERFHGTFDQENGLASGYGLALYTSNYGEEDFQFWGHNGGINGFLSNFIYNKELGIGIAMSANLISGNRALLDAIVNELTPCQTNIPVSPISGSLSKFETWEGTYALTTTRNEIFRMLNFLFATTNLTIENDSLYLNNFLSTKIAFTRQDGARFISNNEKLPDLYLSELEGKKIIFYDEDFLQQSSGIKFWIFRILIGLAILTSIISFLKAVVYFFGRLLKRTKWTMVVDHLFYAASFICFALVLSLFLLNSGLEDLSKLGQLSPVSLSIFLFSIGIAIFPILACYHFYKTKSKYTSLWSKIFYPMTCLSSLAFAAYCLKFGWVGLALWIF